MIDLSSWRRRAVRSSLGVFLLAAVVSETPPASAQETAYVRVASTEIGQGLTGTVSVAVEGVRDLYGADIQVRFDPTLLRAEDANPSKPEIQLRVGTFLSPDFVIRDSIDNASGSVHYAVTQLNPSPARDGDGILFTIEFRALGGTGSTDITVTSASLATRGGERIPHEVDPGRVTLVPAAGAPATPTPFREAPPTPRIAPDLSAPPAAGGDPGAPANEGNETGSDEAGPSEAPPPGASRSEPGPASGLPTAGDSSSRPAGGAGGSAGGAEGRSDAEGPGGDAAGMSVEPIALQPSANEAGGDDGARTGSASGEGEAGGADSGESEGAGSQAMFGADDRGPSDATGGSGAGGGGASAGGGDPDPRSPLRPAAVVIVLALLAGAFVYMVVWRR